MSHFWEVRITSRVGLLVHTTRPEKKDTRMLSFVVVVGSRVGQYEETFEGADSTHRLRISSPLMLSVLWKYQE